VGATELAEIVLLPSWVPQDITRHWIPLRDWNVFYRDWIDHGGADALLTNYEQDGVKFQIADTPNHLIVGFRPELPSPPSVDPEDWVVQRVEEYMSSDLYPLSMDDVEMFRVLRFSQGTRVIEGDWIPQGPEHRRTPPTSTLELERVKFFTNGQMAVLSVPKFLWEPTSLVNPFADRFPQPASSAETEALAQFLFRPASPTPRPFASDPEEMEAVLERLLEAHPTNMLELDWGRRLNEVGVEMNRDDLDALFEEVGTDRLGLWHAQQLAERVLAEGAEALADQRYDEAANRFSQALVLDPLNVSAALLLEMTRARAEVWAREADRSLPLPWFEAAEQALERHRSAVAERKFQMQQRSERYLALTDLRTQWLEAYGEKDFRRARQILDRMQAIDPGDASTLFFIEMIEGILQNQSDAENN
jgi:tetratricopeptide (TPR) repeat protein